MNAQRNKTRYKSTGLHLLKRGFELPLIHTVLDAISLWVEKGQRLNFCRTGENYTFFPPDNIRKIQRICYDLLENDAIGVTDRELCWFVGWVNLATKEESELLK